MSIRIKTYEERGRWHDYFVMFAKSVPFDQALWCADQRILDERSNLDQADQRTGTVREALSQAMVDAMPAFRAAMEESAELRRKYDPLFRS